VVSPDGRELARGGRRDEGRGLHVSHEDIRRDIRPDIHRELHRDLGHDSRARRACTQQAYRRLPRLENPYILDLGCGRGGPTRELARLSRGRVVGLDTQRTELAHLREAIRSTEIAHRILVVAALMQHPPFSRGTFDVLWSEGAIHIVGLDRGLPMFRPYLRPAGFLVIHEMCWLRPDPPPAIRDRWQPAFPEIGNVDDYVARIPSWGFKLLAHFTLPEDFWWNEYYGLLSDRIQVLRKRHAGDQAAQKVLDREQQEVDLYRQHMAWYGSVFLIMQRDASSST